MAIEFSNVKAFSATSKDLCEAMKEFARENIAERKKIPAFQKHSREEMNKLINKEFALEVVKQTGFDASRFGEGKEAMRKFSNMTIVREFANSIQDNLIDLIIPDILMSGALPYIADIKFADLGDSIKFDIKSNQIFTVSKAGYRKRRTDLQKSFKTTVTMVGENHEITIGADLFEIMTGQADVAEDIMRATLAMEASMMFDAYDAFTTSANALTGNLAVANYDEKSLIKLCETVTEYNGGRKAVIFGTPGALKTILPANQNYRYLLSDDYVRLGSLQVFNGFDVIPMTQVANPYASTPYSLKLDDTKIYVVSPASDKIVKLGIFGGSYSRTDAPYQNANKMVETTIEKAYSCAVITNSVAGVVKALA
jgi:hypothetical protein